MDNNHKMNEEELSQVAGGIPLNYKGKRKRYRQKCINCGKEFDVTLGLSSSYFECFDCRYSPHFKKNFRAIRYRVFGHDYNKD